MRKSILVFVGVALLVTAAHTQSKLGTAAVKASTLQTPWGDPDLQGVWNYAIGTPLERPSAFAGKEFLTDDELAQAEKQARELGNFDRRDGAGTDADVARDANEFWFARKKAILTRRTSMITDPRDGKLPALTPEAAQRQAAASAARRGTDSWEDRNLQERCIASNTNQTYLKFDRRVDAWDSRESS